MEVFESFLDKIENPEQREKTEQVLAWVATNFPDLQPKIAWNQPIFTDHETFIVGFSVSKQHLAMSPEQAGIEHFTDEIKQSGYEHTKNLVRFKWGNPIDYELLKRIIQFNIIDKANCDTFWRKE